VNILEEDTAPTADELAQMQKIREETGDHFCRRCEYCMPCEHGVQIVPLTILSSFGTRMPLKSIVEGGLGNAVDSFENCVQCHECEKKCPYDLQIVELLQENVAYFHDLQKQFGAA
jgi:predicted aldo/keto reductase-like oxidoreductase